MRFIGALLLIAFLVVPPAFGGAWKTPALDKFDLYCAESSSEKTTTKVCGGADLPLQLLAQRWTGLAEFTISQYEHIETIAPIEVYILPYWLYERRLFNRYPHLKRMDANGGGIVLADTYPKEKGFTIVIETFFLLDDDTFIHELHHHILPTLSWLLHDHVVLEQVVTRLIVSDAYKTWLRNTP